MNTGEIRVQLQEWKGYSAYEVAVRNGFTGTQKEWLESLKGGELQITVCGKNVDADGNIVLYATDIRMKEGALNTIATAMETLDKNKMNADAAVDSLESEDAKAPLSANQGKALREMVENIDARKTELKLQEITVPAEGWAGEGPWTLTMAAEGVTADCMAVLGVLPDDAENEEAFEDTEIMLVGKAEGEITLRVRKLPAAAFRAGLALIVPGVIG